MRWIVTIWQVVRAFAVSILPVVRNYVLPSLEAVSLLVEYFRENVKAVDIDKYLEQVGLSKSLRLAISRNIIALCPNLEITNPNSRHAVFAAFRDYLATLSESAQNALIIKLCSHILRDLYRDKKKGKSMAEHEADALVQLVYSAKKNGQTI